MNIEVRYFTRSGNTKLLAETIADALGVNTADVNVDLSEKADVLFLGSSVYASRYDPAVGKFIEDNADKIGLLVSFGSSASGKSTWKKVKETAEEKGIRVCDEYFSCPGHFLFLHKDRPNGKDLADAAVFARSVCEKAGKE